MTQYKTLEAMGIQHPEQIARYQLYSVDHTDVLRIIYDRKKGSVLPVSRKYRFAQIRKSAIVDSGTRKTETLYESSQQLRNAVAELEKLIGQRSASLASADLLKQEVRMLEEEFGARITQIKSMIAKL